MRRPPRRKASNVAARERNASGIPLEPYYDEPPSPVRRAPPGEFPFTRGIRRDMYRGRHWTMRQYAGFATAAESNERYRFLLAQGVTGLSVAFDLPTQLGHDSDAPQARGEVGKVGVAIDTIADVETLFDGIPLDRVTVSMTINAPASILLAFVLAVARRRGIPFEKLGGTVQNDVLKEYVARGTYIYPPGPSMRLVTDVMAYCAEHVPNWNTISISGYHIREAGSTALQEIAFTLADAKAYLRAAQRAGLDVDAVAPRISFFWNAHNDFFEEVAKFRAARTLWAQIVRDEFGSKDPALADAPLSHADRRLDSDRPGAGEQRRPRRAPGACRRARRHAVAAHERPGRSARAADGAVRTRRAAHAADHRQRERRDGRRRSAGGLVLRRGAHRRADRGRT